MNRFGLREYLQNGNFLNIELPLGINNLQNEFNNRKYTCKHNKILIILTSVHILGSCVGTTSTPAVYSNHNRTIIKYLPAIFANCFVTMVPGSELDQ